MIYLDMDGVVANFDRAKDELLTEAYWADDIHGENYTDNEFWALVKNQDHWFRNLPLMHDAKKLVNYCKKKDDVRSARPKDYRKLNTVAEDKIAWADQHFPGVPVEVCLREEKVWYHKPGDILIDDNESNIGEWLAVGGTAIFHISAMVTINILKAYYKYDTN